MSALEQEKGVEGTKGLTHHEREARHHSCDAQGASKLIA